MPSGASTIRRINFFLCLRRDWLDTAADYISRFTEILAKLSGSDGKPYSVTASIGCAVSKNQPELDFEALLSEADVNMYKHKVRMKRRREDFKDSGTESR